MTVTGASAFECDGSTIWPLLKFVLSVLFRHVVRSVGDGGVRVGLGRLCHAQHCRLFAGSLFVAASASWVAGSPVLFGVAIELLVCWFGVPLSFPANRVYGLFGTRLVRHVVLCSVAFSDATVLSTFWRRPGLYLLLVSRVCA